MEAMSRVGSLDNIEMLPVNSPSRMALMDKSVSFGASDGALVDECLGCSVVWL